MRKRTMMKKLLTTSALSFLTTFLFAQADTWLPIVQNGFGPPNQLTVPEMEVYNDTLYVATAPIVPPGTAKLWRSGTGTGPWQDVTPTLGADLSIHSFGKTDLGGGYFWLGTGNGSQGCIIYQSQDGSNWTPISDRGFGSGALLPTSAPNMVVFHDPNDNIDYLYAGAGAHGAGEPAEVWRIPYTSTNPNDWVKLVDFDTVPTAIPDTADLISYFEVWNGKIYFGTNAKGQLWESSDGVNFTQNMGVEYGFSMQTPGNIVISAIEIFNDTMYLTTTNFSGGQLWRSGDGIAFTSVTLDAFGEGVAVNELRKPVVAHGQLWVTGYTEVTESTGTPIWRSDDGLNWVQSNTNGFNDTLNNGQNPSIVGFQNYMYFGGPNYTAGGQVWRTDVTTGINEVGFSECDVRYYPNPITTSGILTIDSDCDEITTVDIYNINGQLVKTITDRGSRQLTIETNNFIKGIYFIRLSTKEGTTKTGKVIID
jgi:hypothetical protein